MELDLFGERLPRGFFDEMVVEPEGPPYSPHSGEEAVLLQDDVLSDFSPRMGALSFASRAVSEPFPCLADELEQEAKELEVQWRCTAEPTATAAVESHLQHFSHLGSGRAGPSGLHHFALEVLKREQPEQRAPAAVTPAAVAAIGARHLSSIVLGDRLPTTSGPSTPTRPSGSNDSSCNESEVPMAGAQEVQSPVRPLLRQLLSAGPPSAGGPSGGLDPCPSGVGIDLQDLCCLHSIAARLAAEEEERAAAREQQEQGEQAAAAVGSSKQGVEDEGAAQADVDCGHVSDSSAARGPTAHPTPTVSSNRPRRSKRPRTAAAGAGTLAAAIAAAEAAEASVSPGGAAEPQLSSYSDEHKSSTTLATLSSMELEEEEDEPIVEAPLRRRQQKKRKKAAPPTAQAPKARRGRPARPASAGVAAAVAAAAPAERRSTVAAALATTPAKPSKRQHPKTPDAGAGRGLRSNRRRVILAWNTGSVVDPRTGQRVTHVEGGTFCTQCFCLSTPVWRAGPFGPKSLCNACGVRFMKTVKNK